MFDAFYHHVALACCITQLCKTYIDYFLISIIPSYQCYLPSNYIDYFLISSALVFFVY
jgi:hypothetical protein